MFYFVFCYAMSRYARYVEHRLRGGRQALRGLMEHRTRTIPLQAGAAQHRGRGRAGRRAQVVRRFPCAARHQPAGRQGRAHRDLRAVGLRQVDHDPLHQPARGASAGPYRGRRRRTDQRRQEDRRGAPRRRHGVPALQPVSAPDRAGEPDAGADLGAQDAEGRRRGNRDALPAPGENPRAGRPNIPASSPAASSSASRSRGRSA